MKKKILSMAVDAIGDNLLKGIDKPAQIDPEEFRRYQLLARFPEENPNPVMLVDRNFNIYYSNQAGRDLLQRLVVEKDLEAYRDFKESVTLSFDKKPAQKIETQIGEQIYSFVISPIEEQKIVFVYGEDITQQKKFQKKLSLQEQLLARSQKIAKLGGWSWDLKSEKIHCTQELLRIFDLDLDTPYLNVNEVDELIHPEDKSRFSETIKTTIENLEPMNLQHRVATKDNLLKIVHTLGEVVTDSEGNATGYNGTVQDITEDRKKMNQIQMLAKIFENASEAIVITDEDNRIIQVNPGFERTTGFSLEDVLGEDPKVLASGRYDKSFYEQMWDSILNKGEWEGELWDRRKNGEIYPKWLTIRTFTNEITGKTNYIGIFKDITERKRVEEDLKAMAYYDQLTGLPNRMHFMEVLERSLSFCKRNNKKIALMFVDLDGFKQVNDTFGHLAGDDLLCQVSRVLQGSVRESDIVARLGGDEFVIGLIDIQYEENAKSIAELIVKKLMTPFNVLGESAEIGGSIGVSLYPSDGETTTDLMKKGDQAMYYSKSQGKGCVHLFHELPHKNP